jgi:hypothetical protein
MRVYEESIIYYFYYLVYEDRTIYYFLLFA